MKNVLLIILLSIIEVCYAQFIPHKASITPSKNAVLSSETFTVTYSLTEVQGYIYIGVQTGHFEVIGKDRWEGYIKIGETVTVTFIVKLKESSLAWIEKKVSLGIGFSRKSFGERIGSYGEFKSVLITITDFNELKYKIKGELEKKDSCYIEGSKVNINLEPQIIITVPTKTKTLHKNPDANMLESSKYNNSDYNDFKQEEKRILKDSTKSGDGSIQYLNLYPIPYDTNIPGLRKEIILDTNSKKVY